MTSVDWHDAGMLVGNDLAETGGTAANIDVDDIGFAAARTWLDGVLDGLHKKGLDAKSIAVSSELLDSFRDTIEWREDETYRGVLLMILEEAAPRQSIVIAV